MSRPNAANAGTIFETDCPAERTRRLLNGRTADKQLAVKVLRRAEDRSLSLADLRDASLTF
jgi:hypothetical protein